MARKAVAKSSIVVSTLDARAVLLALNKMPKEVQQELRQANYKDSVKLAQALIENSNDIGVPPVAEKVAESIKPARDRFVKVNIGGTKRVGRPYRSTQKTASGARSNKQVKAMAGALMWGSEYGSKSGVDRRGRTYTNRFAAKRSTTGYWIAPTVREYGEYYAMLWRERVQEIIDRLGLD